MLDFTFLPNCDLRFTGTITDCLGRKYRFVAGECVQVDPPLETETRRKDHIMRETKRTTKSTTIIRSITLGDPVKGRVSAAVVEIDGNKVKSDTYYIERIPSDFGTGFNCIKVGEDKSYDVLLDGPNGSFVCDCPWMTYRGHIKPCRHIEMCRQALHENKLPYINEESEVYNGQTTEDF